MKTLISNERTDPHDPEYKERRKKSLKFIGTLQGLKARVTITDFDGFTDQIDSFTAKVPRAALRPDNTYKIVYMTSLFTETQEESQLFRVTITYGGTPGTSKETWKVADVANGTGSGEGSYIPTCIRIKSSMQMDSFKIKILDEEYSLEKKDNYYYWQGGSLNVILCTPNKDGTYKVVTYSKLKNKVKKQILKNKKEVEIYLEKIGAQGVQETIYSKQAKIPICELRANTDNHLDTTNDGWMDVSAFESTLQERNAQIAGRALLVTLKDKFNKEKDVYQEGILKFPNLNKNKIKIFFKVFFDESIVALEIDGKSISSGEQQKVPNTAKESLPLKIIGKKIVDLVSIKFEAFVINKTRDLKNTIFICKDNINIQVLAPVRMCLLLGDETSLAFGDSDAISIAIKKIKKSRLFQKDNYKKIAPKGRYNIYWNYDTDKNLVKPVGLQYINKLVSNRADPKVLTRNNYLTNLLFVSHGGLCYGQENQNILFQNVRSGHVVKTTVHPFLQLQDQSLFDLNYKLLDPLSNKYYEKNLTKNDITTWRDTITELNSIEAKNAKNNLFTSVLLKTEGINENTKFTIGWPKSLFPANFNKSLDFEVVQFSCYNWWGGGRNWPTENTLNKAGFDVACQAPYEYRVLGGTGMATKQKGYSFTNYIQPYFEVNIMGRNRNFVGKQGKFKIIK